MSVCLSNGFTPNKFLRKVKNNDKESLFWVLSGVRFSFTVRSTLYPLHSLNFIIHLEYSICLIRSAILICFSMKGGYRWTHSLISMHTQSDIDEREKSAIDWESWAISTRVTEQIVTILVKHALISYHCQQHYNDLYERRFKKLT